MANNDSRGLKRHNGYYHYDKDDYVVTYAHDNDDANQ